MRGHGTCHVNASFESTRSFEANGATGPALPAQTGHVPSRYPETSSEMVRFTSGLRGGIFEMRPKFYHTLQGPCDDTVPALEEFQYRTIFLGFKRLYQAWHRGTFGPRWEGMPLSPLHKAYACRKDITKYFPCRFWARFHVPPCRSAISGDETLAEQ